MNEARAEGDRAEWGSRHPRSSCAPLIGRDRELGLLADAVASAPSVTAVEGEVGVGKSRLVRELVRGPAAADRRVLVGHCHRLREPFPLGPVIEALRGFRRERPAVAPSPLLGALRPLLPELGDQLPPEPGPLGDPRAERHRIFRGLRELLGAYGPTLCILEDLHWADEGTFEFLSFLAATPPQELSVVLTCRAERGERPSALSGLSNGDGMARSAIDLAPLSTAGVRELARAILETDTVSREFATSLHERTAGIPFAVEELLRQLRGRGDVQTPAGWPARALDELAIPGTIREAVLRRLAALGADARQVVSAAAILEGPTHEGLVIEVAGLSAERGSQGLGEAMAAGALQEHGAALYGFRHALACQAAYEAIPGTERRRLHLRAGRVLESRSAPRALAAIAHHMKQGGGARWPLYAESAASAAAANGEDRLAASLLEDALEAQNLPRAARVRMAIALGDVAICSVSPQSAIRVLRRTIEGESMPTDTRGELRLSLSRLLGHAGESSSSRREAVRAVGELRRRPELAARAMVNLAQPLWTSEGERGEHLAWLGRAVKTVRRQDDPVAQIAVTAQRAAILLSLGDRRGWAAARDIPSGGDTVEEKLQLLRGYHALGLSALSLGHRSRAGSFLAKAERINSELEHQSWGLWLAAARAYLDWFSGRWEGLEDRLRVLVEETEAVSDLLVGTQFALGSLLMTRGKSDEAPRILASALETAQRTHSLTLVALSSGRLARAALDRGDARAARRVAATGLAVTRYKRVWVVGRTVVPELVDASVACGDLTSARRVLGEFAFGLRGRDAPAARAALASCRGALAEAEGRHEAAARDFGRAEAGWGRLSNSYESARAKERRARCALAGGDERGAEVLLGAMAMFDGLGADADTKRVGAQLKAARVWRGGRRGYGDELSPREAEVARLAGMRQTNRQIAEALFISPRTVERHVASALRKLGLESRHALRPPEARGASAADMLRAVKIG